MIKNPLPLPCMALSSRHAGWKPAHPCGAGVMGCIAVCGRDACAPGMRARRLRSQVVYHCMRAGRPCSEVGRRRRAGSLRTQVVYRGMRAGSPRTQAVQG